MIKTIVVIFGLAIGAILGGSHVFEPPRATATPAGMVVERSLKGDKLPVKVHVYTGRVLSFDLSRII